MKILSYKEYLKEGFGIKKVSIDDIKMPNVPIENTSNNNSNSSADDYHGKNLRSSYSVALLRNIEQTFSVLFNYGRTSELESLATHVRDERFSKWEQLGRYEKFEKNKKRSEMGSLKDKKLIATMYAAFTFYYGFHGENTSPDNDKIISLYMDRLKRSFGVTVEDIINTFFE